MQINYMDYVNKKNFISPTFLKFGVDINTNINII